MLLLLLVPMHKEHVLPLQVKLVDPSFSRLHVLVLLQALHTKYGVQLTHQAVLSSVATTAPVAQVYSAQLVL